MQPQESGLHLRQTEITVSRNGILALSGYGISIAVERGHLIVRDGIADERGHGRLHRATSKLKRLVILGHTGFITLDALRWLRDVGAAVIQIDRDGVVTQAWSPPQTDIPQLRRAQALAPWSGVGMNIRRDLVASKLRGQTGVIRDRHPSVGEAIAELAAGLEPDWSSRQLRQCEGQAAAAYWYVLASTPLHFARRAERRMPAHWAVLGSRMSVLTKTPRNAVAPGQAILNYLYALLEAETRIACLVYGLDPGLGVFHTDVSARDSLCYDLMEPLRPVVDRWLLGFLAHHVFTEKDFVETQTGQCRVLPPLTTDLAQTLPLWKSAVAPVVEDVVDQLLSAGVPSLEDWEISRRDGTGAKPAGRSGAPTLLSEAHRSAASRAKHGVTQTPAARRVGIPNQCKQCGAALASSHRTLCPACHQTYFRQVALPSWLQAGREKLATLRAEGTGPSGTPEAQMKRAATQRKHFSNRAAWEQENARITSQPDAFRTTILPALQSVPVSIIVRTTGLSLGYVSAVKAGRRIPHPMWWDTLAALAEKGQADELDPDTQIVQLTSLSKPAPQ